jgi:secreted trypsin-like serine protease
MRFDLWNNIGLAVQQGDSGGPLNCNYPDEDSVERVVAGVTSWGISSNGVCNQDFPSIYTRTSAYLDWIKKIIEEADNVQTKS